MPTDSTLLAAGGLLLAAVVLIHPAAAADRPPTHIVLAGDSTVTENDGWGVGFAGSFRDNVTVTNLARGGRSSKSFRDEGHWQKVLDADPDVVLIQFGHNDEPGKGPERETDPATTFKSNIETYVEEVRAAGGKPVLVTPLARRRWTPEGRFAGSSLDPYAEAIRQVATDRDVPLIELHEQSIDVYRSLGEGASDDLSPVKDDGGIDQTHLNEWGGKLIGMMVSDMLRRSLPELADSWKWNGIEFPDPREGKDKDRPVTAANAGTPTPQGERTLAVAADGSAEFETIQQAIDAVPSDNSDRTVIDIGPGTYLGPIIVGKDKINVTFRGHGPDQSVLTYALNVKAPLSDDQGYFFNGTGVTVLGDGFIAENLTFQNTSGDYGQGMALRMQGDRAIVRNCRLLGWQDTLLVHSNRQFFYNCHIEGRVDFIYGGSTAVFYRCTIKSKLGGYITASNAPEEQPFGLVFIECNLVSDDSEPTYLGRPWRPFAAVAYIDSELGPHIRPEGWDNWGNPENEKTARYSEHNSTGPGAHPDARVGWSRQLTDDEAARYTIDNILAGDDGWSPRPAAETDVPAEPR